MLHYSKVWDEGRKWIVCNLWSYIGDHRYKSGFPGIWESDESYISDQFEFKLHFARFPLITEFSKCGSLSYTRSKVGISKSSFPSLTQEKSISISVEIYENFSRGYISNKCSYWKEYFYLFSSCTGHFFICSFLSISSFNRFAMAKFDEGILVGTCPQNNIATTTSIATKRSSVGDILLTTPGYSSVTTFSCLKFYRYIIY